MFLFHHDCEKQGHRYSARYDEKFPEFMNRKFEVRGGYPSDFKEKIYVCDICTICGHTIHRERQP